MTLSVTFVNGNNNDNDQKIMTEIMTKNNDQK